MTISAAKNNQLVHETSPYLLQDVGNPVHWQAWNAAVLDLARCGNKPHFAVYRLLGVPLVPRHGEREL